MIRQTDKINFTHFFSIPLNTIKVQSLYKELRKEIKILSEEKHSKLHLTLFLLELKSQEQQQKAVEIFQRFESLIQSLGPIYLRPLKINYFGKSDQKARVLYLDFLQDHNVRDINFLTYRMLCEYISNGFLQINKKSNEVQQQHIILDNEKQTVHRQLHLTLRSSRKNQLMNLSPYTNFMKSVRFNKDLLIEVNQIHLSTRFKFDQSGFYEPLYVIDLNVDKNIKQEELKEQERQSAQQSLSNSSIYQTQENIAINSPSGKSQQEVQEQLSFYQKSPQQSSPKSMKLQNNQSENQSELPLQKEQIETFSFNNLNIAQQQESQESDDSYPPSASSVDLKSDEEQEQQRVSLDQSSNEEERQNERTQKSKENAQHTNFINKLSNQIIKSLFLLLKSTECKQLYFPLKFAPFPIIKALTVENRTTHSENVIC